MAAVKSTSDQRIDLLLRDEFPKSKATPGYLKGDHADRLLRQVAQIISDSSPFPRAVVSESSRQHSGQKS
jgi:hypothetical protein